MCYINEVIYRPTPTTFKTFKVKIPCAKVRNLCECMQSRRHGCIINSSIKKWMKMRDTYVITLMHMWLYLHSFVNLSNVGMKHFACICSLPRPPSSHIHRSKQGVHPHFRLHQQCTPTTRKVTITFQNLAWASSGRYSRRPKWVKAHTRITLDAKWRISFQILAWATCRRYPRRPKWLKAHARMTLDAKGTHKWI